ncbi:hypothetical protein FEM48_Zijuj08G0064400 [Ziziphus jujuba var. spinosa]|uniref:Uncharacterized protein n=1 Tax=Ziziphus jujuba var. spinosa TaxID=714518 RepID=A0A978UXH7_ZIZJJ|nr:hypothetical protein FEM48_Zijuj08G0064400 [Ziziphus jujuba var. spinosa]
MMARQSTYSESDQLDVLESIRQHLLEDDDSHFDTSTITTTTTTTNAQQYSPAPPSLFQSLSFTDCWTDFLFKADHHMAAEMGPTVGPTVETVTETDVVPPDQVSPKRRSPDASSSSYSWDSGSPKHKRRELVGSRAAKAESSTVCSSVEVFQMAPLTPGDQGLNDYNVGLSSPPGFFMCGWL